MGISSDWHHLLDFIQRHPNEPLALATLIACEGSSYRQPGARLLVNQAGQYAGSLSGGCLEHGIARAAHQVLIDGESRLESIDTQPHFGCPGLLSIVIEKIEPHGLLEKIAQALLARHTLTLTTTQEKTSLEHTEGLKETIPPRPRLLVCGWTSDHEPLFQIAQTLNWDCHRIVKDETLLKSTPRVASESLSACPPSTIPETFPPDSATALVVMSHHLASDLAFLQHTLRAGYPYVGLLGSKRRRETLLNELGDSGLFEDDSWIPSFHAPIGLDLGASHPTTIALAIISEIQAALTQSSAGFLTQKLGAIHPTHSA